MTAEDLVDIEAIKILKSRYFRFMDTKQWDNWAALFTADFYGIYTGDHPDIEFHGRDDIVSKNREMLAEHPTVHHGHNPEITLTGKNTAEGVWAMMDYVDIPGVRFQGYGHYHDEYRKEQGEWRISKIRLSRIRVDTLHHP
ncbi:MAG: nuclear transport factor 2 family protein [Pseudomonadota bacterium]